MSRFFPDPHGPVNTHPGPDFDRPPAPEPATRDPGTGTAKHQEVAANPDAAEAGKAGAQHELDQAGAVVRMPQQEAEAG